MGAGPHACVYKKIWQDGGALLVQILGAMDSLLELRAVLGAGGPADTPGSFPNEVEMPFFVLNYDRLGTGVIFCPHGVLGSSCELW